MSRDRLWCPECECWSGECAISDHPDYWIEPATPPLRDLQTRLQAAEAEARTERERREEAERRVDELLEAGAQADERQARNEEAAEAEVAHWKGVAAANDYDATEAEERAEAAEARLSTAQDALREIAQRAFHFGAGGCRDQARQAPSNPTPSERKGHHPATPPPQDREAG